MRHMMVVLMITLLSLLVGMVSAQDSTSLLPNELYFQTASKGEWQVVDSENGRLTLSGINRRLQYTMTTPRLWSVALENTSFVQTWSLIPETTPLEAILSFGDYNIRLLISNPIYNDTSDILIYTAQVIEVINFVDETSKEIPLAFDFPTLTIQPTLDFTLALMDAASTRLEGTRNADLCARLYDNYLVASQTFTDFMMAGGRNDDPAEFERLQFELYSTYNSYFNTCIGY